MRNVSESDVCIVKNLNTLIQNLLILQASSLVLLCIQLVQHGNYVSNPTIYFFKNESNHDSYIYL